MNPEKGRRRAKAKAMVGRIRRNRPKTVMDMLGQVIPRAQMREERLIDKILEKTGLTLEQAIEQGYLGVKS